MAVNESWRLVPFADVLYACDGNWWKTRKGVPEFHGLKLTNDAETCTRFLDVHKIELKYSARFLTDEPGIIATGCDGAGNSGSQAVNLALQFGAKRIVLVGFDMRLDLGVHWHGSHVKGLSNPKAKALINWRRALDTAASDIRRLGVEMLNASPVSTVTAYPFVKLEDVLS